MLKVCLLIDEEDIPASVALEVHKEQPDFSEGIWAFVDIDLSKLSGKVRRINVTISERILTRIDNFAIAHGESRSGFIAAAAMEYTAAMSES